MKSKPIAQLLKLEIFTLYLSLIIKLSQFFPKISFICKESASAFKEKKNIEISVKILCNRKQCIIRSTISKDKQTKNRDYHKKPIHPLRNQRIQRNIPSKNQGKTILRYQKKEICPN